MPVSASELFAWHERPGAFERLSPGFMPARVVSRSGGIKDGARVSLAVPVGPVSTRWDLEHVGYIEGQEFRDVQRNGPFASWEHVHRMEPDGALSVLDDTITYRLPAPPFGALVADAFTRGRLERLLAWRNDPATRQASHTSDAVDPAAHRAWLSASLASPTRRLWIAGLDSLPVGTLRADRPADAQRTTLSWTVAPALRGCGVGRAMVCLAARQLDEALHAEVRVGNTASLQIAQAAGLVLEADLDGVWHLGRAAR